MKDFDVDSFAEMHSYDLPNPFTSGGPKKRKANYEYFKKSSKPLEPLSDAELKKRQRAAIRAAATYAAKRARKKKNND
jgi:hypothetical protein